MEKIEEIINRIDMHQQKETKKVFKRYLKQWPWFFIFCFVGLGIGYFVYKNSPNTYLVKSRILVTQENQSISSVLSFDNPIMSLNNQSKIENKIGILQSYTLFKKALGNLNWKTSWYEKKLLYNHDMYGAEPFQLVIPPTGINAQNIWIKIEALNEKEYHILAEGETNINGYLQAVELNQVVKFGAPFNNEFFNFKLNRGVGKIGTAYYLVFNNLNYLTNQYLKKTKISLLNLNADLITIMIKGTNKQKETDFINELNRVFIQFGVENKNISSNNSLEFIDSQLSRIKTQLKSAEENFSNYRRNNQVINLSQEAQLIYEKLEEIENEKYMTQLQIDYYKDLQQYLDDSEKISEMVNPSVIGITDVGLNNMLAKLMDLYRRREILLYSVKDKSPTLHILDKEIKITRDGLEETLKNQLKTTQSILKSVENRYKTIESRIKQLPETEKELIGIQREFDLNNELYTYLLQKRAEASISKASIAPEVQVLDPALAESSSQIGPSLVKDVGFGAIGGLLLPFIFITLMSFFNTKIESKEEVERNCQIPVLAAVIKHKYKDQLPVISHPRSGIAESLRGVRSNINTLLKQPGCKVLAINSLIPKEGKSFIASNLSIILAKSNNKVLLVGADLHKPSLHKIFKVKESSGLSNYLKNECTEEEIITATAVEGLDLIQAGTALENPSYLLNNEKLETLINDAKNNYNYVIIDNAPMMLIPDTIILNNLSAISLFVLRLNYSSTEEISQINKIVKFNKLKKAAIVINGTPDLGYGYGKRYWKKGYGEYRQKMSIA